jgi:hypothetical protein
VPFSTSIYIAGFIIVIVFTALFCLFSCIKIFSFIVKKIERKGSN